MKKRALFSDLVKYLDNKEALVITGMRQVGKTTLMRQIYDFIEDKPKLWFDFENPLEVKLFEDIDYNTIYKRVEGMAAKNKNQRLTVFIDEIQIFPEITKVIKYLIDHYRVKFIVTGSSNYYLKNLFPESLSGRKFLFQLDPLKFQRKNRPLVVWSKPSNTTTFSITKNLKPIMKTFCASEVFRQ